MEPTFTSPALAGASLPLYHLDASVRSSSYRSYEVALVVLDVQTKLREAEKVAQVS